MKTLSDSIVPPPAIRECFRLLKKSDKKVFRKTTEVTEGFIDSDEEDALHKEIDAVSEFFEASEARFEGWWEKQGARLFNQLALNIVQAEGAYTTLHQIMVSSMPAGKKPDPDPLLQTENVARAFVVLQANTRTLDLDKAVSQVHDRMKDLRLLLTPLQRRANSDTASGHVRFSTLIAASSVCRASILHMDVNATLCLFCKSSLSEIFNEQQARFSFP